MSRDVVFTPAHKVVIDCLGFIVAERVRHDNRGLVFSLLAEALPHAGATENRYLDHMIMAAIEVSRADQALTAKAPDAAAGWLSAHMSASHAFAEFSAWRLGMSAEKFHQTLVIDGAA